MTAAGTTVEQTAPPSLPDADGVLRSFLYWDTGRRITGKRKVRWTFNHPTNWSEWPAAAFYGIPPTGTGGMARVVVDAHWVGTGPINPTPIDGPGSTFVNGPGGTPIAWPGDGDDHIVRTQWGAATIHAKDHLQRNMGDPLLDFSSWQQLVYGGDAAGYFEENDDDITWRRGDWHSQFDVPFFRLHRTAAVFLAGYVVPVNPDRHFQKLIEVIRAYDLGKFIDKGDPSEDIIG